MDRRTEIARNSNIETSPRSIFTSKAAEKLFLYELGEHALTQHTDITDLPKDEIVEEIGRQLDEYVKTETIPSLLEVKSTLAEEVEIPVNEVTLEQANTRRNQLMIESVPDEEFDRIVRSFL